MPDLAVILPAAGRSTRFGGVVSKIFHTLAGRPVLTWTMLAYGQREDVGQIVVAASDVEAVSQCTDLLPATMRAKITVCAGGNCRAESVRAGVLNVSDPIEWIAVHDAARPLVSRAVIDRTFAAAREYGAAAAALPMHLTIKQAVGPLPAKVQATIPRHQLWAMQTPQIMRRHRVLQAMDACPIPLAEVTDDVQLLELQGDPVWLVEGEERNLKITTPMDLRMAEIWMDSSPEA